jgi:hypothetical protein
VDGYVYDVNATPKTEVARLTKITVKKVWNSDASTEAEDSVTVQLLKDGRVIETATLSAKNNWQIVFDNMPESDAYSVKEVDVPKGFTATQGFPGQGEKGHLRRRSSFPPSPGKVVVTYLFLLPQPRYPLGWAPHIPPTNPNLKHIPNPHFFRHPP